MSRRSRSSGGAIDLPGPLRYVIHAAERECPQGHAGALRDLIGLALRKAPARGIFDPTSRGEHELFTAVEGIATRHLGRARARAAWRGAIRHARLELDARDRIERAAQQVQAVSDMTYFYAGLAFGLTWMSIYRGR